jgi:hypothetical protein
MSEQEDVLARLLGIDDETAAAMKAAYAALQIEWHCPGRHGVVRKVRSADAGRVQQVIEWHQGNGACRWTAAVGGFRSVEFVAMTKVYPPPKKPWDWCGTTVLFPDWQAREAETTRLGAAFQPGDPVVFAHRGVSKHGLVGWVNGKSVAVLVAGEGQYRVPPNLLLRDGD